MDLFQHRTSFMTAEKEQTALPTATQEDPVRILFGLLILWSLLLSAGSLLFAASVDWRKPLIVLGTMGFFLGTWWLAIQSRRRNR